MHQGSATKFRRSVASLDATTLQGLAMIQRYCTKLLQGSSVCGIQDPSSEAFDVLSNVGPDKQDYITRTFSKLADSFIKNPTKKICVPYSISGATSSNGVIKYRTKVETEMKELLVMSHKIAELENKGHSFMNQINFVALPQLGNEIDNKKSKEDALNECFENIKTSYSTKKTKKNSHKNISNDAIIELCTIELRKKMEADPTYKEKLVDQLLNENA